MDWSKLLNPKRVGQLRGKEPSEDDSRTPFERDYGRAVFSTPVRRLQDKTQVFPLEEHDAVRTRLTHSLEVSSVARSLARQAGKWIFEQNLCSTEDINHIETIAATCGLIHDLGNPPFGHAGESAIQSWFEQRIRTEQAEQLKEEDPRRIFYSVAAPNDKGEYVDQHATDFLKWEGNAQTLRLISKLQVLADEHGMNLTCATFSAACKYVAPSNSTSKSPHQRSKPGFFASEESLVRQVADEVGTGGARNPITYLVEASDDIVYSTGDLEDAVKKGILDWEFVREELRDGSDDDPLVAEAIRKSEEKVGYNSKKRPRLNEEVAQAFRTKAIGLIKDAVFDMFCSAYKDIMAGQAGLPMPSCKECHKAAVTERYWTKRSSAIAKPTAKKSSPATKRSR